MTARRAVLDPRAFAVAVLAVALLAALTGAAVPPLAPVAAGLGAGYANSGST